MYTAVLMLAMTSGAESVDFGRHGCHGYSGCYASCSGSYNSGCSGYSSGCSGYHSGCCGGYYRAGGYSHYGAPGNYAPGMAYQQPGGDARQSYYSGPGENRAMIRVMVPDPNAEIWFDGSPTKQRGHDRVFHSSPIEGSGNYGYKVKAKWMENGRPVEQERQVRVQPGQSVMVDFRGNAGENLNSPKTTPERRLPKSSSPDESK